MGRPRKAKCPKCRIVHGTGVNCDATRSLISPRTCFRCGREFRGEGAKRVCPACVVPKIVAKIALHAKLSIRERQVTALVIRGKLNKEIAFELHLTEGTVKEYMNRIFRKLGIANRVTLAMWALTSPEAQEQGLTSPEAEQ